MITGGWFRAPGGQTQHWRRHGIGESVCSARVSALDNGSLFPFEGVTICQKCMPYFKAEVKLVLPKCRRLIATLESYA